VFDDRRISRRALLAHLALASAALAQSDDDPLRQLRSTHPRLILLDSDLDRIKNLVRDSPLARQVFNNLEKESEALLNAPPADYKLPGPRLIAQVHHVVDRVTTLALMYRLTGRNSYLRRAVVELRAVAGFKDWNPARFVDTAELTFACALGYDWLYNALSPVERAWLRDAILLKGIDLALPIYSRDNGYPKEHFNWNMVCNASFGIAAMAVAPAADELTVGTSSDSAAAAAPSDAGKELTEKCATLLRASLESIPHGLTTYGIEGSWPEGPDYWNYVTKYACLFFSSLETALGNDYGLSAFHGVDRSGRFRIYMTGPGFRSFNFGDSTEDAGSAPQMFWLAKRFSTPAYAWDEQKEVEKNPHSDAFDLAWFDKDAQRPQPPAFPLDAVFRGVNVASFRSSWEDPNALFVAVKGGDNKYPHSHFDLGSFVLSAGGVRWAADLGPDDYDLPGYFGARRGTFYRVSTEAHNTLVVDDENQDARAEARITHQEFTPDLSWVQIDLSRAYPGKVRQWTRRLGLAQRQAVLVTDSLRSDVPVEVIWGLMTDADVMASGQTATLHKNGWNLTAEIRAPRHAVFDVAPVHTTPPQAANPNYKRLIARLGDKVTELDLTIVLTPWRDGQVKPKVAVQFPA
jgi:hypothetical protein